MVGQECIAVLVLPSNSLEITGEVLQILAKAIERLECTIREEHKNMERCPDV
jgi:hypothetical protein